MATDENSEKLIEFQGMIRQPKDTDLMALKNILDQSIVNSDTGQIIEAEVNGVLARVLENANNPNSDRKYLIAEDANGEVVGMMGMVEPGPDMLEYCTKQRPIEFINAYVDKRRPGAGVGSALVKKLTEKARLVGFQEIIVNSGPRYKNSGWGFWSRQFGDPIDIRKNLYGDGLHAPVWRADIE